MSSTPPNESNDLDPDIELEVHGNILDIKNSPAFVFLDELLNNGKLTSLQVDMYKNKYTKLHEVVIATYDNEKVLLNKAKELHNNLTIERIKLDEKSNISSSNSNIIQQLKTDLDREAIDVANMEERKIMLKFEMEELERNKEDLIKSLEEKKRRQLELLQPTMDKIQNQTNDVIAEINQQKEFKKREEEARNNFLSKIDEGKKLTEQLESSKLKKRQHLLRIKNDPDRMSKQVEMVQQVYDGIVKESERIQNEILTLENQTTEITASKKDCENKRMKNGHNLDMLRSFIQKRETRIDDIKRQISVENDKTSQYTENIAGLEMNLQEGKLELRHTLEYAMSTSKLYEEQKKRFERIRRKLDSVLSILPPLETQYNDKMKELDALKANANKQQKVISELKQDVDVFISSYLKQEKLEEDKTLELEDIERRFVQLEETITSCLRQERELEREVQSLSAQRERASRDVIKVIVTLRENKEEINIKDLIISDYGKKLVEVQVKLKNGNVMYEIVKSQRNKYAHMLAASARMLAEMKEKIKIFQNEVEILRSESLGKEKNLAEEARLCTNVQYNRDALRIELNRTTAILRDKKDKVNRQFMEIDKLNSIINGAEKEMIRIRDKYSKSVDQRNMTGIQLIDRNDELCILHEKFNIQSNIIEKGVQEMQLRVNEIRVLESDIRDITWKIDVTKKRIPTMEVYSKAVSKLQQLDSQLNEEKEAAEKLILELESPNPQQIDKRVNRLDGDDPNEEQLTSKIEVLQDRLNEKREMLLERNLILDEVTNLSDNLKNKAAEGRSTTLDLAKTINDYQGKIRKITHKMMATVSELSMYQATSMKLEQEKTDKEQLINSAQERLEHGLPPTDDTEYEWIKMERERQRKQDMMRDKAERDQSKPTDAPITRTTAETRPNAYIPDDVGLPRPYGVSLPFKPTAQGSQMRHFRKPDPKPIEL